jgi:NAD(P)-dependent dehydrogenase (short-subunit alcohol dehydrogenase family)
VAPDLDVNLTAPFVLWQLAAAVMSEHSGGSIVNVASVSAISTPPRYLAYSRRTGSDRDDKALAAEWSPTIRVNAVVPGFMDTELDAQFVADGKVDPETPRLARHSDGCANRERSRTASCTSSLTQRATWQQLYCQSPATGWRWAEPVASRDDRDHPAAPVEAGRGGDLR